MVTKRPIAPTCYACDAPPTSLEHAPPRLLFPEQKDAGGRDLRRRLITVPSCDAHNSEKSKDDEYLLWVLSANAFANETGVQQANTKLDRSYLRRPKLGDSIFATMQEVDVVDSRSGIVHEKLPECDLDVP